MLLDEQRRPSDVIQVTYPWLVTRHPGHANQKVHAPRKYRQATYDLQSLDKEQVAKVGAAGGAMDPDFHAAVMAAAREGDLNQYGTAMTDEFWQAAEQEAIAAIAYESNFITGDEYQAILDDVQTTQAKEFALAASAMQYGYDEPGLMSQSQWGEFAERIQSDAYDDLRYSNSDLRRLEEQKLRGPKSEWGMVGGKHVLVRNSAVSATEARRMVSRAFGTHKDESHDFMLRNLEKLGYQRDDIKDITYGQARHLLAEVGQGFPDPKWGIRGLDKEKRWAAVNSAREHERLEATSIATNPLAAEGLDKWDKYIQASLKAGGRPDIPPDDVVRPDSVPAYVTRKYVYPFW